MSKNTAAFFDFDHTLLEGDSQGIEVEYLRRTGRMAAGRALRILAQYLTYKVNLVSAESMVRLCIRSYKGVPRADVVRGADVFYSEQIRPRLRPRILSVLDDHRQKGHTLVLLSASVPHIIESAGEDLGFDLVFCTQLEEDGDGHLTGEPDGAVCISGAKKTIVEELAAARDIDLAASYAYSDHHTDLPFLETVGHPVAVSPTRRLRAIAKKRAWSVLESV